MAILTHAKFHFYRLIVTLVFGIRASEPPLPLRPGERLKRPGLIGLSVREVLVFLITKEQIFWLPNFGIFSTFQPP